MSWDVVGQERAVTTLRRAVDGEGRLSHAYLFAGPEHVGRATTARLFAQALNCTAKEQPSLMDAGSDAQVPCGECRTCRLISENKHPDVEWIGVGGFCEESEHKDHGADGSRDIRICQVRRLERVVARTAVDARYRVLIIDPAEAMTNEAANAFLKTLEEPSPQVVIVLITAREEALPETVRSRCRRVAFSGVPRAAIETALRERWSAEPEMAARLSRLASGRLGWAVAALQDERLLAERDETLDDIESVVAGGLVERFKYAASLGLNFSRDPSSVQEGLELWSDWWRDVLVTAAGREELASDPARLDTLRSQASQYGVVGAVQALRAIRDGRLHLDEHASPTLAMETMLLDMPVKGSGASF